MTMRLLPAAALRSSVPVLFAFASVVALACSSSEPPASVDPTGSCRAMASACHPYDKLSDIGHECHELGHAGDDTACAPRKDECLAACPPRDAGSHTGTDDAGAEHDAAPEDASATADACDAYCACVGATCAAQDGYPFATPASCAAECAKFSLAERTCWSKMCASAQGGGGNKEHLCEHAWGEFGLDECD